MEKYIDKSALVAEIEKRIKNLYPKRGQGMVITKILKDHYEDLLSFINTLEVKEVDLDSNIRTYLTNHFNIYEDGVLQSKKSGLPLSTYDIIKVAEHFFELGMAVNNKAQKGE